MEDQQKVIAAALSKGAEHHTTDSESVLQHICQIWVSECIRHFFSSRTFFYTPDIPPCFVVDAHANLHHSFGDVIQFMRITGKATLNILKLVKKELSISLGVAIRRAAKEKRTILYKDVHIRGLYPYSTFFLPN